MGSHDLDHPDELRVDLDPVPGAAWPQVREVALLTREVERRTPDLATSRWWKEERHGVFIDHNRNARDRTVASAYSRSAPPRRPRCRRPRPGTRSPPASRRRSPWRPCPDAWRGSATLDGTWTPPSSAPLIEVARAATEAEAGAGLEHRRAGTRRSGRARTPTASRSTPCAVATPPGPGFASTFATCRRRSVSPRGRSTSTTIPGNDAEPRAPSCPSRMSNPTSNPPTLPSRFHRHRGDDGTCSRAVERTGGPFERHRSRCQGGASCPRIRNNRRWCRTGT